MGLIFHGMDSILVYWNVSTVLEFESLTCQTVWTFFFTDSLTYSCFFNGLVLKCFFHVHESSNNCCFLCLLAAHYWSGTASNRQHTIPEESCRCLLSTRSSKRLSSSHAGNVKSELSQAHSFSSFLFFSVSMIGHHLIPRYMEENRVMGLFCWWDDPEIRILKKRCFNPQVNVRLKNIFMKETIKCFAHDNTALFTSLIA